MWTQGDAAQVGRQSALRDLLRRLDDVPTLADAARLELTLLPAVDAVLAGKAAASSVSSGATGDDWDLGETSEFLLVAATLLDLKAARLLPAAEVEDEEDLALLAARDLLFTRLLQYKAFKEAAAHIADLEGTGARRWPRLVTLEPRYAEALPELVLGIGPERLLKLALRSFPPGVVHAILGGYDKKSELGRLAHAAAGHRQTRALSRSAQ